jgi:hypothetical protein
MFPLLSESASMAANNSLLRLYSVGLACTFAGAGLTELTGSFVPLAMGASATLMCTVKVVRALCDKRPTPGKSR